MSADLGPLPPQSWFVARTKPRQEKLAETNLLRQGYATYLPQLKVLRRIRRQQVARLEPMFPAYLFFAPAHPGQSISPVRSTPGVANIVRFGAQPACLSQSTLAVIRAAADAQNQESAETLSALVPGCKVKVMEGPLAGLEGLISAVSAKRVEVLMHLLGSDTRVLVPLSSVDLAA
jgi:transcriptional antiterminator RfaH